MEKIKQFLESETGKKVLMVLVLILVGLGSFELGRLSKENNSSGVKITYPVLEANVVSAVNQNIQKTIQQKTIVKTTKNYFASSRGTKYYPIGCSAGGTIKQENRIYFSTVFEAEKAGYILSSSCK